MPLAITNRNASTHHVVNVIKHKYVNTVQLLYDNNNSQRNPNSQSTTFMFDKTNTSVFWLADVNETNLKA